MQTISKTAGILVLAGVLCAAFCRVVRAESPGSSPTKAPKITLTRVPSAPPGESSFGEIAGVVKNAPKGSRVVLWSLGDTWYVQPFANQPFTVFGSDGKFSATIHGGFRFAAMLVKAGYTPEATTPSLPRVGGNVLAIIIVLPGK